MIKKTTIFLLLTMMLGFLILPQTALAECSGVGEVKWIEQATGITDGLIIPCECLQSSYDKDVNKCGLSAMFQMLVNFSQVILAMTGSAALLMFTYGGVMFIIAAGNQERIQKGKAAMQAAAIGIVIILGAYLIVNFLIYALTGGQDITQPKIFDSQNWFSEPK